MACSSGINVSAEVAAEFSKACDDNARFTKFQIVDEKLVFVTSVAASGSSDDDFALLQGHLEEGNPCYLTYRLDDKPEPACWIFILYVPSQTKVRDRMLYASTRESVKKDLGLSKFCDEIYANGPEELTLEAYKDQQFRDKADAPITEDERALEEERSAARDMTKQSTASVAFPMSDDAREAISSMANGDGFVQLRVDATTEVLELAGKGDGDVSELVPLIADKEPRFIFLRFLHQFAGETQRPLVFLYTCPEESPIKLKMLYSTCKNSLLGASSELGTSVDKTIECRDLSDIDTAFLTSELHPEDAAGGGGGPAPIVRPAVAKPGRPGARGGRRLMK